MSMDGFRMFLEAAGNDPRIAEGARRAVGEREDTEGAQGLAGYARAAGYDVAAEDVAAFDRAMRSEGDLSAAELDALAGGGPIASWLDGALATVKKGIGVPIDILTRR